MGSTTAQRVEVDGCRVDAETLWATTSAFGHFTAMQVRGGRTRGLALHLDRLEAANRELFDADLDRERICELVRHALGATENASVRVYVFESDPAPTTMVTVREPGEIAGPQRLMSVHYERPNAHLKHLATGQGYYGRLARGRGYDDALLTSGNGAVSETAVANVGFFDGSGVVWPDAPLLRGITMQLLDQRLRTLGVGLRRARVRAREAAVFAGAFVCNARGVAAVSQVDAVSLPVPTELMTMVGAAYASVPWDSF